MIDGIFETKSAQMERMELQTLQVPADDVDRVIERFVKHVSLAMSNYEGNAYRSGTGVDPCRSLPGAAAGPERASS